MKRKRGIKKISKYILNVILIIYAVFCSDMAVSEDCQHTKLTFKCVKYLYNYDGDTVTFHIPNVHPLLGDKMSVRLYGVDTPEIKGKDICEKRAAQVAKRLVQIELTNAKIIHLKNIQKGKYFRIVADIIYDGKSLSDLLISKKLAYRYYGDKKLKINWCR